jgi:hypothetical protein
MAGDSLTASSRCASLIRIKDETRAKRLAELAEEQPTVEADLYLLKLLQEEAIEEDNPRFAMELAKVRSTLFRDVENTKIRRGELLAKTVVLSIAQRLTQILANKVAGRFEGWEEVMDEAKGEIITLICDSKNPDEK